MVASNFEENMYLKKFLTEYDENIISELNVDPLGLQVIWSAYGKKIFQSRVSSISNDLRNYTINLFHHYLIREIIEDEDFSLSKKMSKVYPKKDLIEFKYACLVYFENIFVYSIIELGNEPDIDSSGVLGISNARRRWHESDSNPQLTFSSLPQSHILVRQTTLGVSGRYKTPLVEIGLFDKNYNYDIPTSVELWESVSNFVESTDVLVKLKNALRNYLKELFMQNTKKPAQEFITLPKELKSAYVNSFKSSGFVGTYSREFWLNITGLDQGVSGALLAVIEEKDEEIKGVDLTAKNSFHLARTHSLTDSDLLKISNIEIIEPFLSNLDLIFSIIVSKKAQSIEEVVSQWEKYGRSDDVLKQQASVISLEHNLINVLSGTGLKRLTKLLKLKDISSINEQIMLIIAYHNLVMSSRGQLPWLSIDIHKNISLHVKPRRLPSLDDRPIDGWVNNYYIPQFKNLVRGFQGIPA